MWSSASASRCGRTRCETGHFAVSQVRNRTLRRISCGYLPLLKQCSLTLYGILGSNQSYHVPRSELDLNRLMNSPLNQCCMYMQDVCVFDDAEERAALLAYLKQLPIEYHKQYQRFNQTVKVPRGPSRRREH